MKKILLLLVFVSGVFVLVRSQTSAKAMPFSGGERIEYEVAYNWGILWVDAGKVFFETDTSMYDDSHVWYFNSEGETYRFYDIFFKVRDHYQSKVDITTFRPLWFDRDTYEGGYEVKNQYTFDYSKNRILASLNNSYSDPRNDTLELADNTYDVLSAIYYMRSYDFSALEIGQKIPLRFIIDGEVFDLYIRYLGKEVLENRDGKKYDCIKFSAMLVEGTIFKKGENLIVWVTDDDIRVPVMVEAEILVGSIKAYMVKYQNLKHKLKPHKPPLK